MRLRRRPPFPVQVRDDKKRVVGTVEEGQRDLKVVLRSTFVDLRPLDGIDSLVTLEFERGEHMDTVRKPDRRLTKLLGIPVSIVHSDERLESREVTLPERLPRLRSFVAHGPMFMVTVRNAQAIAGYSSLEVLHPIEGDPWDDISWIRRLPKLRELELSVSHNCDLTPLLELPELSTLALRGYVDVSPLAGSLARASWSSTFRAVASTDSPGSLTWNGCACSTSATRTSISPRV